MKTNQFCFDCAWFGPRFDPCEKHSINIFNPDDFEGRHLADKAIHYLNNQSKGHDLLSWSIESAEKTEASYIFHCKDRSCWWIMYSDDSYIAADGNTPDTVGTIKYKDMIKISHIEVWKGVL